MLKKTKWLLLVLSLAVLGSLAAPVSAALDDIVVARHADNVVLRYDKDLNYLGYAYWPVQGIQHMTALADGGMVAYRPEDGVLLKYDSAIEYTGIFSAVPGLPDGCSGMTLLSDGNIAMVRPRDNILFKFDENLNQLTFGATATERLRYLTPLASGGAVAYRPDDGVLLKYDSNMQYAFTFSAVPGLPDGCTGMVSLSDGNIAMFRQRDNILFLFDQNLVQLDFEWDGTTNLRCLTPLSGGGLVAFRPSDSTLVKYNAAGKFSGQTAVLTPGDDITWMAGLSNGNFVAFRPTDGNLLLYSSDMTSLGYSTVAPGTCDGLATLKSGVMATISGTVRGNGGSLLTGAKVELLANGNPAEETLTDNDGEYTLECEPGEHTLRVTAAGYRTAEKTVEAAVDPPAVVDFQLLPPPVATTFYVKPDGDDSNSGLSREAAWKSIGNGDRTYALAPGASVVVMAGDYTLTGGAGVSLLKCSGTPGLPITYKAEGAVNITMPSTGHGISIGVDHVAFDGFAFTGTPNPADGKMAFVASGRTGIEVRYCKASAPEGATYGPYGLVLFTECTDIQVHHNLCLNEYQAIQVRNPVGALICNNTCVSNYYNAIGVWGGSTSGAVVKNNIISGNMDLSAMLINDVAVGACDFGYNTFYAYNVAEYINGEYYDDPIGIGETTQNPMLDLAYRLMDGSPCFNTGVDVGLPYWGAAPDRGAFETLVTNRVGDVYGARVDDVVSLTTSVVTAGSGVFTNDVLVVEDESRAAGVRVQSNPNLIPVDEGARIAISGKVTATNGINTITATDIDYLSPGDPLAALGMIGKSVVGQGLKNHALLVKTWGRVRVIPGVTAYFLIDDGSSNTDGNGNAGLPVLVSDTVGGVGTWPTDGSYVAVVGIAGVADLGGGTVSVVFPRGAADID